MESQRAAIDAIPNVTFIPFSSAELTSPHLLVLRNMLVNRRFGYPNQNVLWKKTQCRPPLPWSLLSASRRVSDQHNHNPGAIGMLLAPVVGCRIHRMLIKQFLPRRSTDWA